MKRATAFCTFNMSVLSISIHALVKRATHVKKSYYQHYRISIHALVKRATSTVSYKVKNETISIHALVKRATFALLDNFLAKLFQSTPS